MNWGTRIVILYVGFVALIMTLVGMSMSQRLDLVSTDYYQQEMQYQQRIENMKATNCLSEKIKINNKGEQLEIIFPNEFTNHKIDAQLHFYCDYDARKDFKTSLNAENLTHFINTKEITNGRYTLKIEWTANGKSYYQESPVSIHH